MMTDENADPLSQIRDALEKLLNELPPEDEHAGIVCTVIGALDEEPLEKCLEMMAIILMRGYTGLDGREKYISHEIEKLFRQAFALLLRGNSPLSRDIRDTLSDLIAMDDEPRWRPRKIEFGFRKKGNRSDPGFENTVAAFVEKHWMDSGKVEDGIEAAITKFELDEWTVWRYWSRYSKAMKAMGFRMTKPGRKSKKSR